MRGRRIVLVGAVTVAAGSALAPAVGASTLGSAAIPEGATPQQCNGDVAEVVFQEQSVDPAYTTETGGELTSWSVNVTGADVGEPVRLVVIRPGPGFVGTVVAVDSGEVPVTPPASGIATFTPAAPITLEPGDRLGLSDQFAGTCYFSDGSIDPGQRLLVGEVQAGLSVGAAFTTSSVGLSPEGYQLNLQAEVTDGSDVRVTAAAGPANAVAGGLAQLSGVVTNVGSRTTPVTITDAVPAGLRVERALLGGGSCAVAGQQVTCTVASLAAGAAVPLVVLVTPAAAGSYPHTVSAAAAQELTPADNSATATLTVAPAPSVTPPPPPPPPAAAAKCIVPRLKRTPARVARSLLEQLDCAVAPKNRKKKSRTVPRGSVIKTNPGRGEYAAGEVIKLVVSSGKPKRTNG